MSTPTRLASSGSSISGEPAVGKPLGWSFFLIKPDAVRRNLIGTILARLEGAGLVITGLRRVGRARPDVVTDHYAEHHGRVYFDDLVRSIAGHAVVVGTVRYPPAKGETVNRLRALAGPFSNPPKGTIRGDFAVNDRENSIHTSADARAALRESGLWFNEHVF